jgi:hypothetical protein
VVSLRGRTLQPFNEGHISTEAGGEGRTGQGLLVLVLVLLLFLLLLLQLLGLRVRMVQSTRLDLYSIEVKVVNGGGLQWQR